MPDEPPAPAPAANGTPSESVTVTITTTDPPAPEIDLESDVAKTLVASFANVMAAIVQTKFDARLAQEKAAMEKKAREAAAGSDADSAEEEAEKEKEKEKPKPVASEDMLDSLCKIDCIWEDGERKFVPWDPNRGTNDEEPFTDEYGKWVMVLRRVFEQYEPKKVRKTKLDIKSPLIRKTIKENCPELMGAMETEKSSIDWPDDNIFRWRDHIREGAEREGPLAVKHVKVLMDLVEKTWASQISDCKDFFARGVTSYEVVRQIFWPGDLVFAHSGRHERLYRVTDAVYRVDTAGPFLSVSAVSVKSDGKEFGTCRESFAVREFQGIKYIEELNVFPLKYSSHKSEIKKRLLLRGWKYQGLLGQKYLKYKGIGETIDYYKKRVSIDSRVMVDTETFNRLRTDFEVVVNVSGVKNKLVNGKLQDEELMMCTHEIPVFSFMDKDFYTIEIDKLTEIVWNETVFEKLVLPESQKELVRVLVENHAQKRAEFDDFVEGKGQGLVCVLHGPPGCGKTMTAESVAEHTKRPLYMVTSGELGSDPAEMESELTRVLDLAKTWNAVVLLDEADVFLEQRSVHDLVRNSLVSIFLRHLEYFKSIMFLTTNRVSTFDEAFHSRIHVSLRYRDLSPEARMQVWKNFAGQIPAGNISLKDADYQELSKEVLNGRQIKNMFRTCQALAADKKEKIGMKHMEVVLDAMRSFDLASIGRGSDVEK